MRQPLHLRRLRDAARRRISLFCARRRTAIYLENPIISFTFDDFPASAAEQGLPILREYDARATFFASFGLRAHHSPVGLCFSDKQLGNVIEAGHEIGNHTFAHSHAWDTSPSQFRTGLIKNNDVFAALFPGQMMRTMSYPISIPRPGNKRVAGRLYSCCRGGGQELNVNFVDANYVKAFFLEKSAPDLRPIRRIIDDCCTIRAWLIFATHDIATSPTHFGCTPAFFQAVLRYAVQAGATILPLGEAWRKISSK